MCVCLSVCMWMCLDGSVGFYVCVCVGLGLSMYVDMGVGVCLDGSVGVYVCMCGCGCG